MPEHGNLLELLKRENDYMDNLLSKVKDAFKIDQGAAHIDLEVYLTKLRAPSARSGGHRRIDSGI